MDEPFTGGEHDQIYCEAVAEVRDVIYCGSEDENYQSSVVRKQRYEAAGQRYLSGQLPTILSASLRGPFDRKSGWINPWRSKHRTQNSKLPATGEPSPTTALNRLRAIRENNVEPQDSLECHLPSPQSLKQARSYIEHPYLEEDELAVVHTWRDGVGSISEEDTFWQTNTTDAGSSRKRRGTESQWLRTPDLKRRKQDAAALGKPKPVSTSKRTPLLTRSCSDNVANRSGSGSKYVVEFTMTTRSKAATSRVVVSQPAKPKLRNHKTPVKAECQGMTTRSKHSSQQRSSPTKRVSPRSEIHKNLIKYDAGSDDELSRNRMAAATLSSPTSQSDRPPQTTRLSASSLRRSQRRHGSPKPRKSSVPDVPTNEPSDAEMEDVEEEIDVGECEESSNAELFETQHDRSFFFRKRAKEGSRRRDDILVKDVQSELSGEESNVPSSSSLSELSSKMVLDGTTMDRVDEPTSDASKAREIVVAVVDKAASESSDALSEADSALSYNSIILDEPEEVTEHHEDGDMNLATNPDTVLTSYEEVPVTAIDLAEGPELHIASDARPVSDDRPQDESEGFKAKATSNEEPIARANKSTQSSSEDERSDHSDHDTPLPIIEIDTSFSVMSSAMPGDVTGMEEESTLQSEVEGTAREEEMIPATPLDSLLVVQSGEINNVGTSASFEVSDAAPSESGSADFSLKNVFRRLIPSASWSRLSQMSEAQGQNLEPEAQAQAEEAEQNEQKNCEELLAMGGQAEVDLVEKSIEVDQEPEGDAGVPTSGPKSGPNVAEDPLEVNGEVTRVVVEQHVGKTGSVNASLAHVDKPAAVSISQQTPWAKSHLWQDPTIEVSPASHMDPYDLDAMDTPCKAPSLFQAGQAQSPWVPNSGANAEFAMPTRPASTSEMVTSSDELPKEEKTCTPSRPGPIVAIPIARSRLTTPEPQFSIKSFASFMSPSPEQPSFRKRQSFYTRTNWSTPLAGTPTLVSAMKQRPGSNSSRRVSWAPLPEDENVGGNIESPPSPTVAVVEHARPASPPPMTRTSDLPTSDTDKFSKHFSAVATRAVEQENRILPSESQRSQQSQDPLAMAEAFLAADKAGEAEENIVTNGDGEEPNGIQLSEPLTNGHDSQASAENMHDIFDEMREILNVWDVNAELDAARIEEIRETPAMSLSQQSPW